MSHVNSSVHQIIRGGLVLNIPGRQTTPADILIAGDTIEEVGPPGMDGPNDATVVDATDRLLIPGLVNSHTHGHGSLGKGLGDKWSLELLLNASPWIGGGFSLEDKRTAAELNAAEMILKGCTAAYDMYFEFPTATVDGLHAVGTAYQELGVRVVLSPMMADITLYFAIPGLLDALPEQHRRRVEGMKTAPHEEHLAACRAILEGWPLDRGLVRPALGPTIPLHCTDDFLIGCRDMAREHGIGLQMHLAESKVQAVAGIARYGKTLAAHLEDLNVLGPNFTGAHCVWLDDDDISRMADNGCAIAHNPSSNLRLGSGVAPARKALDAGITLGIGSDGSASSDNQNMFEAMRAAAFVSRIATLDPETWLGTWEVLEAATTGGAHVLGMDHMIGRLEPGYKADIVFLDLTNINFVPLHSAANQIVNCEDSSAVDSVMAGGRLVLRNRQFTSFDYEALRNKAAQAAARLTEANTATKAAMEAIAGFVSSHCVGLVCSDYHVHRRIG